MRYNLTKDDAINLKMDVAIDTLDRSRANKKTIWLKLVSVIIALVYVNIEPAGGEVSGIPTSIVNIFMIYVIQFPLCVLIVYQLFRLIKYLGRESILKIVKKYASEIDDDIETGERCIKKERDEIIFSTATSSRSYKCNYITEITEHKHSYIIRHEKHPLIIIPKMVCNLDELKKLIFEQGDLREKTDEIE